MIDKKLNTIIRRAFQVAKIKSGDVDLTENELNDARYSLNTMLKSWDNRGFHIWKRKISHLILNKNQNKYYLPEDLCFENIYPSKIVGIQQTGQYFLPVDVENLVIGMDVIIPNELNENVSTIKEVLEDKIRLSNELFRTFTNGTVVFCGENVEETVAVADYTTDTTIINLSTIAKLGDVIFFQKDDDTWVGRKITAIENGSYYLNESIVDVSIGNKILFGDLLYKKEITEDLNLEFRTIRVKDTKGYEEGKLISYFDGEGKRFYNTILVVDDDKIILKDAVSETITNNYLRKSIYDIHKPFSMEQYTPAGSTLEDNRICYFDDIVFFQGENVKKSTNNGLTWDSVVDSDGDQVQAYFINKIDDRYYFFHGASAWYMDETDSVATKLNILGHTVLTQSYLLKNIIYKFEDKYYILELEDDYNTIMTSDDGINFTDVGYPQYNFKNSFLWNGIIYMVNLNNQIMLNLRDGSVNNITNIITEDLDSVNIFNLDNIVFINNKRIDGTTLEQKDVITGISFEFYNVYPNGNIFVYANSSNNTTISPDFVDYLIIDSSPSVVFLSKEVNVFYLVFADKIIKYSQPIIDRFINNYTVVAFDKPIQKPEEISNVKLYSFLDEREEYLNIISREEFDRLPKSANGEPTQIYYDRKLENGIFNVWNTPNEDCLYMEIDYIESIDPLDTSREIPDFTDQFVEAVIYNLAYKLAIEYGVPVDDLTALKNEADNLLEMADLHDNEDCSIFLQPGR